MKIEKYAIIGPESTGKSTLCEKLVNHFKCSFVPEMSRIYLEKIGLNYTYCDVLEIAKLQRKTENQQLEKSIFKNQNYLFSDTEWICIKIWLDFYKWKIPNWLIEGIESQNYSQYFLTDIDIEWQQDPLRQNPNDRQRLFDSFLKELDQFKKKYFIVKGIENERFTNCLSFFNPN